MPSEVSAFASDSERPPAERAAMERALDLARRGWGRVAPNPLVGAVVLAGGSVVAEGYHAEYGGPHAEVVALEAAGERARGATLVVNLEPCAHHGKTPPCTDAILAAGVARVVAALPDPDPQARGGAAALRAKGVAVSIGLLAEAAAALNAPFLFAREQAERPFVALKLATSIDGRIAEAADSSQGVSAEAGRDRGRRYDRTPRQPSAHGARRGRATPAAGAGRVRPARDAQRGRAAREHGARSADVGHVVARRAVVERDPAREQRRARIPPHDVAGRSPHAARGRGPVGVVRGGRGARRAAPRRRSGGPALLGAGAGVARRGRRSGLSRGAAAPARGRAALDAGGAKGSGL